MYSTYLKEIVENNLIGYSPKNEEEVKFWKILNNKTDYFKIHYADDTIYDISFMSNATQEFNLLYKQLQFIEELLDGSNRETKSKLVASIFEKYTKVESITKLKDGETTYYIHNIAKDDLLHIYETLDFLKKEDNFINTNINYNISNNVGNVGSNTNINMTGIGDNTIINSKLSEVKEILPPFIAKQLDEEITEYSATNNPKRLILKLEKIAKNYAVYAPFINTAINILQQS